MTMLELSRRGSVAVLTLNRPPVNAINDDMGNAFNRVLDELEAADDWTVLHIRSQGKVFAAGADLDLIRSWKDAPRPGRALAGYIDRLQRVYRRIELLPKVTFCEIGGAALGGGFELALSCDLRMVAAEAKIGLPETGIGLIPGLGGTQRLTRLVGRGIASRVILTAEPVDGATAERLGLVQWSCARDELEERARAVTNRIAGLPVEALRVAKQCIAAADDDRGQGYTLERELGGELLETPRTQELISAFLDKNKAEKG
ncbi:enoyl-CoA hydratase/isomerase family protein [Aromatoleum petrolei]|uniref:Enoyl-CoA hydratase/isomerase family protein n=2 Tax=Aromatoleum petrolei TaxID=76116 RepID=A0ABX1MR19_9RHOO|nr:enoyl-CoA hydratase/isomerase family protein [Aromatoleum petrolei]NMF88559.1 enoyl-CoA hydratase/isomerase family protein [Aromatoleum petrolei]QTQ34733.1 Enoyl-CoA hydratase/isomerase [Aromatoleum petrolei]